MRNYKMIGIVLNTSFLSEAKILRKILLDTRERYGFERFGIYIF